MATLTVQRSTSQGAQLGQAAADVGGDEFANTGREALVITNNSGGAIIVTVSTPATVEGDLAVDDRQIGVGVGETFIAGPFPTKYYNDAGGMAQIGYSSAASVLIGAVRVA